MSQTTHLTFFSCEQPVLPVESVLRSALEATGARECLYATRSLGEHNGWELFKSESEEMTPFEFVLRRSPIEAVPGQFVPGRCLGIDLINPPVLDRIRNAIFSGLPEPLYQLHVPNSLDVATGWHDIFEASENYEEGHLFGRAFISFIFWAAEVPRSIKEYRDRVLALPAVQEVKRDLEKAVGPLQQCVYWNL